MVNYAMSVEVISTVDADLARVASAQSQVSAAQAQEVPISGTSASKVEQVHAAVASAEAALAAAQASLSAAEANQNSTVSPANDPSLSTTPSVSTHFVDTTA